MPINPSQLVLSVLTVASRVMLFRSAIVLLAFLLDTRTLDLLVFRTNHLIVVLLVSLLNNKRLVRMQFLHVMGGVISQSSSANTLELPQFTSGQLQALLQQLQTHFQPSETIASCSKASISDKCVMASQLSSSNSVSLSINLRFENHTHF